MAVQTRFTFLSDIRISLSGLQRLEFKVAFLEFYARSMALRLVLE
jgi:hypothetical protein